MCRVLLIDLFHHFSSLIRRHHSQRPLDVDIQFTHIYSLRQLVCKPECADSKSVNLFFFEALEPESDY